MNELNAMVEYNWLLWLAGLFVIINFVRYAYESFEWVFSKFGIETKTMRLKKDYSKRLAESEKNIQEIRDASQKNMSMFLEHEREILKKLDLVSSTLETLTSTINDLNDKYYDFSKRFENHKEQSYKNNEDNVKRDCTILRDRLTGGLRYFSCNKDENGNVHISMGDYENLEKMFQEYFNAGGNGTMKQRYNNEFKKYIIDNN